MLKRLIERLNTVRNSTRQVLNMNKRNLNYIYPHNHRCDFPFADNKLLTKQVLADSDVVMPTTLATFGTFYELKDLASELAQHKSFVIKPAKGSGGGGIMVFVGKEDEYWITPGGKRHTLADIKKQITDIIFGVYSFGLSDVAIVEERIVQHDDVTRLSPHGLADIRLILFQHRPVLSMARIPTLESDGKANLHQGAIGLGINIESGITQHAIALNSSITHHPDSNIHLIGQAIPHWPRIVEMACTAASKVPLKYLGIDISVSNHGPVLLEINVRPGLQIQNANQQGMRALLEAIRAEESIR